MALELTQQQKKDQEVANRLRSLSFGVKTTTPTVVSKQPASPNIFTNIGSVLKEVPQAIADVPKKFIAGGVPRLFQDKPAPETYGEAFKQFGQGVEAGPFGSKALSTPEGMQNATLSFGVGGVAKAIKPVVKEAVKSIEKIADTWTPTTQAIEEGRKIFQKNLDESRGRSIDEAERVLDQFDRDIERGNYKPWKHLKGFTPPKQTSQIIAKEAKPAFEGLKDLSTSIVEKLKGRTTVSKQFISDLTKSSDVKLSEKNIINNVLESSPDNISVADFAKKVHDELLPLKRVDQNDVKIPTMIDENGDKVWYLEDPITGETETFYSLAEARGGADYGSSRGQGMKVLKYENITLPSNIRGSIKNYSENVYESPIKTQAGQKHYPNSKKYFGHTRIEDMADNKTRRVIEVQSDLYQKGNLSKEGVQGDPFWHSSPELQGKIIKAETQLGDMKRAYNSKDLGPDITELTKKIEDMKSQAISEGTANMTKRNADVAKLEQYNDPTAHFRMVREEIQRAAKEGKTKLQFPTGETAMKIEGLGETQRWYHPFGFGTPIRIKPDELKIGSEITEGTGDGTWIITDVVGDGKFKAVPKDLYDGSRIKSSYYQGEKDLKKAIENGKESFDISGTVNKDNPIYKFYEKEVGKYLKKFDAKLVTDEQGVNWWEIPLTKEHSTQPVQAFGKIKLKTLLGGAGATGAAAIFTDINNKNK